MVLASFVVVEGERHLVHRDPATDDRADRPGRQQFEQCGVHVAADLRREHVEAEPPGSRPAIRRNQGSRRVPRCCPSRPCRSGRPVRPDCGVVVETDGHVTPFACHARPDDLGLLAADDVDGHVCAAAVGAGVTSSKRSPVVVWSMTLAPSSSQRRAFSGPPAIAMTLAPAANPEVGSPPCRPRWPSDDQQGLRRGQLRAPVQCQ